MSLLTTWVCSWNAFQSRFTISSEWLVLFEIIVYYQVAKNELEFYLWNPKVSEDVDLKIHKHEI